MPELPEVEALVGFLTERAVGRAVMRVDVAAVNVLKTYDPPVTSLAGLTVEGVRRYGKFLGLALSGGPGAPGGSPGSGASGVPGFHLVIHLARAGWLRWRDTLPPAPPRPGKGPLALRVHLGVHLGVHLAAPDGDAGTGGRRAADGCGFDLTEAGTQKRLAVYAVRDPAEVPGVARLGIDPLDEAFTAEALVVLLRDAGRQQIKGVLRDQEVIAGIGNAYSDEVLHAARLSPYKPASNLAEQDVATLHAAIVGMLRDAVERSRGLAAGSLKAEKKTGLRVHGRAGQPCLVCGDTIRDVSFADSALQYCPTCQTGGQVLADRRLSRLLK